MMLKRLLRLSLPISLLAGLLVPSPATALTSSDVSASLAVSGSNVVTTLSFTGAPPSIVTGQNLGSGKISFTQIRFIGHDSAVSASVGSTNPYQSAIEQGVLDDYTMAQPASYTVTKALSSAAAKPYVSVCWWAQFESNATWRYICSGSIPNPNLHTVVSQPTLTLNGSAVVATDAIWSGGTVTHTLFACPTASSAQTQVSSVPKMGCNRLAINSMGGMGVPSDLSSAWVQSAGFVAYNRAIHGSYIVLQSLAGSSQFVWTSAVLFDGSSAGQSSSQGSGAVVPRYAGPEFSSFGSATLAGNKLVTSGKKLDSITSLKVNGSAVAYKINSASELEIELPKDLAPGKYDVEINSVHGKLTHLQGITVKAVVPTKELTLKGEGAWLNYGSLLGLTNIAKQIGSEYTSVKCIVNAADPAVAERLAKRACGYLEANRLRGKAVTYESKTTYKGEGFWVRVVANG